jgi:Ribosomal protein S4/S9 N-terminal domain
MARYTGPDCKRCRREKMKLFLKGAKCETPKCPIEIRPYPPGEHGRGRTKDSEYLLQKREKQKCARIYGILEKQFRGYYDEANRRSGKTGDELLRILESRLSSTAPSSPHRVTRPARSFATGTSWSTARRSTSRATGCQLTTSLRSGPRARS